MSTTPNEPDGLPRTDNLEPEQTSRQSMTGRVHDQAQKTLDDAAERSEAFEQKMRRNAAQAKDKLHGARGNIEDPIDEGIEKLKIYVQQHPAKSAGIAFAAGFLASRLLRK